MSINRFALLIALFLIACGGQGVPLTEVRCANGNVVERLSDCPPAHQSGDVEMLYEGMDGACSLSVKNGHITWATAENGDWALWCWEYGGPIYQMEADDSRHLARSVARGTNPVVNEQGRLGYIKIDEANHCAYAILDDHEVTNNCDTPTEFPQLAWTAFDGENFVFSLLKNPSSSRLYYHNASAGMPVNNVMVYERDAAFIKVHGNEIGFSETLRDENGTSYSQGRIVGLNQEPILDFWGSATFDFTSDWVAYTAFDLEGTESVGHIYLKNRHVAGAIRLGRGTNPVLNHSGTFIAWQTDDGVQYARLDGRPGGDMILGARDAVFDGQWLYYIAPSRNGTALYRLWVGGGLTPQDLGVGPGIREI